MEMLGKCADEQSADFLQPCSLPPPLASASRRRMPVHAAAGSRNSNRRCASPREIRTPGRWRRNRLAHSSIANRRLPRSDAPRNRRKPHSRRPWRAPSVSINKEIELGVRGRWPPPSECTICSDPASRSSSLSRGRLRGSPNDQARICCAPSWLGALAERGVFADPRILPRVILVVELRTPLWLQQEVSAWRSQRLQLFSNRPNFAMVADPLPLV